MALDRYVSNMGVDMGKNLSADNRSELNKIFQIYQQLDLTEDGIEVYLGYVTEKLAPELEGASLPFPTSRAEIQDLRLFLFETLIPNATKLISQEVRVTTGRIMDVIGSELRYMTSLQLIKRFLNTYYKDLIDKYLNRDFGDDYMF